jgi:hypothetical protein
MPALPIPTQQRDIGYDMPMKIISGFLFVAACVSLYFGSGWLLVMPRFGDSYFTPERMMSGVGLTSLRARHEINGTFKQGLERLCSSTLHETGRAPIGLRLPLYQRP